ncbi:MAG: hypothetical protein J6V99_02880 [Neisseriaceae bacterium]|nr:hypothetical protein [Neisseriaceae bacterium]
MIDTFGYHRCDYCLKYTQNRIAWNSMGTHWDEHPCTFVNKYYSDNEEFLFNERDFKWEFGKHHQNDRTVRSLIDNHILLQTVDMGSGFNVLICDGFERDYCS